MPAQSTSPRLMNSAFVEAAEAVDAVPRAAREVTAARTRSLRTLRASVHMRLRLRPQTGCFAGAGRGNPGVVVPQRPPPGWSSSAVALLSLALVPGCSFGGDSEDVPAFDGSDLADHAGDNWPTAGGSLANDRYSTLDEIDTSNVKQLQGVWKTDLRNSGTEAKYSGESQPVVYNGVIYVTTGKNDVFAVDVETGKILWQYEGNLDQKIDTICCGWLNRGVAIGDGKVFQGQLDGKVVALDAKTGDVLWTRQLVKWQDGQVITAAPVYADDRVYIGVVGADLGTRGFLEALDPETGESVWRYYTVPAPGEPGVTRGRRRRVPARRRRGLAGARLRSGPRSPLLRDRERRPRLGRERPAGRQPVDGVDRRDRGGDGQVQVGVPAGPPRHLGLRRREHRRPLRRLRRTEGRRAGGEDRLAVHARP